MMNARRSLHAIVALTCLAATAAFAQRGGGRSAPAQVSISPDGTTVAYITRAQSGSTIHLTTVAGATDTTIGDPACANSWPTWSPDGTTVAYLASCNNDHQDQIWLWSKATNTTRQLTHLKGNLQELAWAPNSKVIAFLFVENATRSAGALDAMKPWAGVIGEDGVEVQRVYAVDTASGNGLFMTPADLHVYEFSFNLAAAEGQIAFIAAPTPGENNWWVAKLYTREHGGPIKPVFDPVTTTSALKDLQIAVPRFSPDGKHIAFIGGLMSDQGSTGGDVWVINADGSNPTDITPEIDGTPTFISWTSNDSVGFTEDRRGHMLFADYMVSTRKKVVDDDLGMVQVSGGPIKNAIAVSTHGTLAFIKSSFSVPSELYAGGFGHYTQLTHTGDGYKSNVRIESIEWENEGFHVQGWLTFPANYDPAKKYPLIVTVHGGPSASAYPRGAQWASQGYFELQPNPRGSFGQGEKFTAANIKDFGYGDLRDILKGVDAVEAKYPIDDHRVGLTGWSYGGFMSMFAATQTHRFAAIVAGAGISDWKSYYGENSIDQWMVPFFGATVYDDPAVYARSSAIEFIHNAKTPMLIIVGDRDGECPAPQSFEMWHALRALGVKTQLVIYPNEGHGFRDPEHVRDRAERTAKWFAENMPAK